MIKSFGESVKRILIKAVKRELNEGNPPVPPAASTWTVPGIGLSLETK